MSKPVSMDIHELWDLHMGECCDPRDEDRASIIVELQWNADHLCDHPFDPTSLHPWSYSEVLERLVDYACPDPHHDEDPNKGLYGWRV